MTSRAVGLPRGGVFAGAVGTVTVHLLAVGVLVVLGRQRPVLSLPTYAVELVAAPRQTTPRRAVREAPPAAQEAPTRPAPTPAPVQPRTAARTTRTEPAPRTAAPVEPLPNETPGTGSQIANVKLDGRPFPYPEYLENIVSQIYRRWARPVGVALQAEIGFQIFRDGTVGGIRVVSSSRSYSFDMEALGAVEAAAAARAFGPLPQGYEADMLQVSFVFKPQGVR